jgi:cobaltochelatase CobN
MWAWVWVWVVGFGVGVAWGAPLKVTVVSRLAQSLEEGKKVFDARWGAEKMELMVCDPDALEEGWDAAEVIVTYSLPAADAERLAGQFRGALGRGARVVAHWAEGAERHWGLRQDSEVVGAMAEYWSYGGVENMARLLGFVYGRVAGRSGVVVEPPEKTLVAGIYHPRAKEPFASLGEYLAWYRKQGLVGAEAPLGAVLFYHTNVKSRDLAHIDGLIGEMERRGLGAVAVFGWPVAVCEPFLVVDGHPVVEVAFGLNLGFAKPEDTEFLKRLNVHVIGLMVTRQTQAEWRGAAQGLRSEQLAIQLAAPERAGATEPVTIATTERTADGRRLVTAPVAERVEAAVRRGLRWVELRRKENRAKRVALVYFNNPPGKGNIGASYLNVPGSIAAVLKRLGEEGYLVGERVPGEKELIALLEAGGRNIEEWAPGELEAMVARGGAVLISMEQYREWFRELPREFREGVLRNWGAPEQSRLMTIRTRRGEPYFVLPGLRLGNVFVGPQPLRSTFALAGKTLHDVTIPPPHSYIAGYLWLRKVFRADAITHVGRHGTLEFLPGKNVGQAGWDASEVLLGDVPAPYFYIIDGGGESTTARRRAAAVMVGHLTPMLAAAGELEEFRALRAAIEEAERVGESSPGLREQYEEAARREIARSRLDAQLGFSLAGTSWEEAKAKVSAFLEETEAGPIPMGVHVLGALPREEAQVEGLAEWLKAGFTEAELKVVGRRVGEWARALLGGEQVEAETEAGWSAGLREKAARQVAGGREWVAALRRSAALELDSYVRLLRGEYLESGVTGDPLRTAASLPSGRNLHDFDPALIPTRAACALGRKLGDEMMARFRAQRGRLPEKVSMVLWYGETMRHQGAMECQALYLMGVEPVWNSRGVVDSLRLVPEAELGRERIDVVVTIAGIYRDGLPEKVLLLDRASRMAQQAGDNALSRATRRAREELMARGMTGREAERAAAARVFGPAPGDYGGGIANLVKQSRNAESSQVLVDAYLRHNNFAYTAEGWGEALGQALATQLKGNEAVLHSRATNLYGVVDNDDFFDFAGGLSLASKTVNGGAAPEFYVANLRKAGRERVEDFRTFLAGELNGRIWNKKWIGEMQRGGYAGAREMFDQLENVYGWQATAPEQVDAGVWAKTFAVYVRDAHQLGLKEFFERENPHARQYVLARLLEVARQGGWRLSREEKAELVGEYVRSVARFGMGCSANTCGNRALQRHVEEEMKASGELSWAEWREFRRRLKEAFGGGQAEKKEAAGGGAGGRAAAARRGVAGWRLFRVSEAEIGEAARFVPLGMAVFGLFLGGSVALGAAQAYTRRRVGERLVELKVGSEGYGESRGGKD